MEAGLRPEIAPELCERVGALYRFVYRKLVDGCVNHRAEPLEEALGILRYERETWSLLLEKLASERGAASSGGSRPDAAGSLSVQG
jgi:flagellar secretion chaperone FliS